MTNHHPDLGAIAPPPGDGWMLGPFLPIVPACSTKGVGGFACLFFHHTEEQGYVRRIIQSRGGCWWDIPALVRLLDLSGGSLAGLTTGTNRIAVDRSTSQVLNIVSPGGIGEEVPSPAALKAQFIHPSYPPMRTIAALVAAKEAGTGLVAALASTEVSDSEDGF